MSSFVILLKLDFETATALRRALTPRGVSSNSSLTEAMFASFRAVLRLPELNLLRLRLVHVF